MIETPHIKQNLRTCGRIGCLILAIPFGLCATFLAFVSVFSPPIETGIAPQPFPDGFMKGISYESWLNGEFGSAESDQTLAEIVVPSGAEWIALIVKCFQDTTQSTEIRCMTDRMSASDDEMRHVIHEAHELGLKVMLKPHIDLLNLENSSSGRFNIGFGADEAAWAAWFASYTEFITHYAELAQELGVEYFVIGTELGGTTHRAEDWREVIRQVCDVYDGKITYAALTYFEPLQITWWDELDAIGIDAYFAASLSRNPTLAQMRLAWLPTTAYLGWLSDRWGKPLILTEVGYMSVDGTNILPGDWSLDGETDHQEQADAYQALFESFVGKDWWGGVFWWSLSTKPDQGGADDRGYSFHDKPAEGILREWFGGGGG